MIQKRRLCLLACAMVCLAVAHLHDHSCSSQFNLAYIGPGAGFAFLGSFLSIVISVLAGLVSIFLWPFRMAWLLLRRKRGFGKARVKKVIFLGLDGLDPELTERLMDEGQLPFLSRLRAQGTYSRLRTTFPPLSPVAWSTFATGVNPARHNIFDFLNRDLRTYAPELSSARVRPPSRVLHIGRFRIPLSRPSVEMRRKSEPFWNILGKNSIGSAIIRVPITFPPEPFKGRLLSAMCTPDLRGTQGTFSRFSTRGENGCQLTTSGDGFDGVLSGPNDESIEDGGPMRIPFHLSRAADGGFTLAVQNQRFSLRSGEYTPWVRLRFRPSLPASVWGIARFLLTSVTPDVSLYVTPIEIDPEKPALPISHPSYYAVYLAKLIGSFATLGMAEDTWALNEGAIDENAFLDQARLIQREREAMFFNALDHTRHGVVACVFDTTDRVQHMFYSHLQGGSYAHVIPDLYRDMDRLVGETLKHVDEQTAFFVLSDHGFCAFRRGVNLNSWLMLNGYLALLSGREESGEYFDGIDWSRTRAYTFGLGGLYLNLRGREARGIVEPGEAKSLRLELITKLAGLRDTDSGEIAITNVYDASDIYRGPYIGAAPDLIAGYAKGYRASWDAAVGKVTSEVFTDNRKAWSGDHCVDPVHVPGILFCNKKLDTTDPGIEDMAPTTLDLFGIPRPAWMEGASLVRLA